MAWKWTDEREKAAALVAANDLGDRDIAEKIGVDTKTLTRWKQRQEFQDRVRGLVAAVREEVKEVLITDKNVRLGALNDRWLRLQRIIIAKLDEQECGLLRARGLPVAVEEAPEAKTEKDESLVSPALALREVRAHEEQAAREMGQWDADKPPESTIPNVQINVAISLAEAFSREELEIAKNRLLAKAQLTANKKA